MTKAYLTAAAFALLSLSSCKKDDDKSASELIVGRWMLTSQVYTPAIFDFDNDGNLDTEAISVMDACDADDLFVFESGGSGKLDEGATKCDPNDDQVYGSFNWQISSDNTITIDYNGDVEEGKIESISASGMVITHTYSMGGSSITIVDTYVKK
jgi:Lipocalin-like domain